MFIYFFRLDRRVERVIKWIGVCIRDYLDNLWIVNEFLFWCYEFYIFVMFVIFNVSFFCLILVYKLNIGLFYMVDSYGIVIIVGLIKIYCFFE